MEKETRIIKTITLKYTVEDFDKLVAKKGELTWETFFLRSAKIK